MFLEHGSFEAIEIKIKKKHTGSSSKSKAGAWFTKSQLEHTHAHTCGQRPMASVICWCLITCTWVL